jgi:glycosyltransferase involved in cell wall biosynthesis
VQHGTTGLTFEPGNPADLAACVRRLAQDAAAVAEMRRAARRAYEEKYMAECNFQMLMDIYRRAIERRADRSDMAARQTAGDRADSGGTRNGDTAL